MQHKAWVMNRVKEGVARVRQVGIDTIKARRGGGIHRKKLAVKTSKV